MLPDTIELSEYTEIVNSDKPVRVVAAPHPFEVASIEAFCTTEDTLLEVLERMQPDEYLRQHAVISINDYIIPQKHWHVVRARAGSTITIRVIPHGGGGGGKNPLRTILMVAVIAASFAFGGVLAAGLGIGSITVAGTTIAAATIGGAIISIVGNLLINALVPIRPAKLKGLSGSTDSESPTLFISGAKNQANLFGPVPIVLGKHRMTPYYGAQPFTEIVGNDQYLRMVFVWGWGPLLVEDIKIGETPIANFSDVQIITRSGMPTDGPLTICTNDVDENNLSILLTQAGGSVVRNTKPNTDEISLDFIFSQGLTYFNSEGKRTSTSVTIDVEYAPVGSSAFVGSGATFAARNTPAMGSTPTSIKTDTYTGKVLSTQQIADYTYSQPERIKTTSMPNSSRYDLVVLDKFTGDISVISGSVAASGTPAKPSLPDSYYGIAYVYRSPAATVVTGNIEDIRSDAMKTAGYFAPTANGTNTITVGAGTVASARRTYTDATSEALRKNVSFEVPRGQYQVRVTRITADSTNSSMFNEIYWGTLRSITHTPPFDATGLATTELLIKATDQLNGTVDELNGIVTSILPDYDLATDTWIARPTQNQASLFRAVLQGPGNGNPLPDEKINLTKLQYWHGKNAAKGLKFNMIRDYVSSVWDTLADVASSAFASPQQVDGKWSVVIDENPTGLPKQHFTPRNSSNFSFERFYPVRPHALRIRFVNELENYTQDEYIVYDDGYSELGEESKAGTKPATRFETLENVGATHPDQIYIFGRRKLADSKQQSERYTFDTDFENLVCTRGDFALLTHDVISVGLASGRVKDLVLGGGGTTVTGIITDEAVDMQYGVSYAISIRNAVNTRMYIALQNTPASGTTTLLFQTALLLANAPAIGDLFGFGEAGKETLEIIVQNIMPGPDLSANITALPLGRPRFNAETDPVPNFVPNISVGAGQVTPFIVGIRSDESVLVLQPSGALSPRILVSIGRASYSASTTNEQIEIQYKAVSEVTWRSKIVPRKDTLEVSIDDVEQGVDYNIKARYISGAQTSEFTSTFTHTVIGMSAPPPDPYELTIEGDFLRWKADKPIDFAGFEVRTVINPLSPYEAGVPMHQGLTTETTFDISNTVRGQRTYMVKMVDIAGNYSVNAATITRDFGDLLIDNIVEVVSYSGDNFPGIITNGSVVSSQIVSNDTVLYLTQADSAYLPADLDLYLPNQFAELTYETYPIIMAADTDYVPARLSLNVDISGEYVLYYKTGKDLLYINAGADADLYIPVDTDPYLPVPFGEYRLFPTYIDMVADQAYAFKAVLPGGQNQGAITTFNAVFDVEDEKETFANFAIAAGGSRLPIVKIYRSIKVVNMTLLSGSTAAKLLVVDKDNILGPLVTALDASGTSVAATADITVEGIKG